MFGTAVLRVINISLGDNSRIGFYSSIFRIGSILASYLAETKVYLYTLHQRWESWNYSGNRRKYAVYESCEL